MQQKIPGYLRYIFSLFLVLVLSSSAKASHIVGLDLFYTWVSGNTYKITLIAYADCGPASAGPFASLPSATPQICIFNGSSLVTSISLAIQAPTAGVEITPVCAADIANTQCTNSSYAIPGIKKFVYSGNYTVPTTSAVWRFAFFGYMGTVAGAGRAAAITNINSGTTTELVDTLNNLTTHNSSPNLTVVPTPFFCLNNTDNYNPGAVDADGDSLSFDLVHAKGGNPGGGGVGTSCTSTGAPTYIAPFTPTAPLAATAFSFDSHTGQISFFPNALQRSIVVYNVREYRNGVVVGTSQREMTFLVLTCTNTSPSGGIVNTTNGTAQDSTHFQICQNTGPFSFNVNPTEANPTNLITVTYSGLPAGASFSVIGNGTPAPQCTFSWTSTGIAPGSYTFYVTFTDNNCPLSGTQTLAYTIIILPAPSVTYNVLSQATCLRKAFVSFTPSGAGSPWNIYVTNPPDTTAAFLGVSAALSDSLVPGSYTITIFPTPASGCSASVPMVILAPPALTITGTFTNPSYCGMSDGTITISGLTASSINSFTYNLNGITQPAIIRTANAAGTVTFTGLPAGVYSNFIATYGNCVSLPIGPFSLTNPAVPPISATFTNPTYCGHNDGTITLHHLHPGYIDTIKFAYNGILQPSQVFTVAADSTITLTGLYAGLYLNISATYGPCASSPVGPITLTNPAIPTPTYTSVNPSYCGHNDGSITISNLHAGDMDTIKYYFNGVLQTAQVILVSATGSVTISGLGAGVYTNITATYGPCVTTALGPVTLTAPPIPTPTFTFINPSYCGHLDGSITISNLHAGDLDTIKFYLNGVLQPSRVIVVSATGSVTISGIGAGVYSNITATYGPCVTTAIGPVTLVNPPILATSATFINPTYCGHNDGSITINNLHAGDLDTIKFYLNGVLQPAQTFVVSAAGTVTITGLLAGVYSNITATYGPCVTSPIGPITLTNPPLLIPTATFTSPTYCAAHDGTITISNLYPGDADTIKYSINGVPQPPVVYVASAAGTIVITGLDQGVYSNIRSSFGPCTTNTVGPFTLVNPPFTMRNVTYTNPTKCGFCNGTITLYGLHPNQVDTIKYNINGVAQPLISVNVPADSTVVIPNLCEGIYSNIIAYTTAACVSNTFGPDTLVAPPIIPGFTYSLTQNCAGDTVVCTNTSWPASDLTYTWYFGDGTTSTVTNPTHVYTAPGVYAIKLVITNTKCYDSTTQTISLVNLVNANFNAVPDSFLCIGKPMTFTNTSAGTGLTFTWVLGDGTTSTATNLVHTYTAAGTYNIMLAAENAVPCRDTAKLQVQVDPISGIDMGVTDSVLCKGGAITFNAHYSPLGNIGVVWTFSSTDSIRDVNPVTYSYETQGTYTVTVHAYYRACPDISASINITIIPYPSMDLGPDTSICMGTGLPILLTDSRNAANTNARWVWNTGATTPSILVDEPGTYTATVNIAGCEASDDVVVLNDCYVNIPNVFTPNGDGVNDFFLPRDLLAKGLTEFKMSIFNRWGELIFETTSLEGRGWDGKFNDVPQPQGVFIYKIDATFKDGQKEHHQGNLTLIR